MACIDGKQVSAKISKICTIQFVKNVVVFCCCRRRCCFQRSLLERGAGKRYSTAQRNVTYQLTHFMGTVMQAQFSYFNLGVLD